MTASSHALAFKLLRLNQGKREKIDGYYKSGMVHPILGQVYSDSSRCVVNGRSWIFSIVQFWIPQFEGILDQLDPLIPWGKGDGNDVETGLYIIQMLLVEVCQRNLG